MVGYINPFEYEAAKKLSSDQILEYFIEDYNYSRFLQSKRNILLIGERGTGKTMTLLYNSLPVQQKKAKRDGVSPNYDLICIYIPCNTTLTHRREHLLLDSFQASIISEHFLVLTIMDAIIHTLSKIPNLFDGYHENKLRNDLIFVLNLDIPEGDSLFDDLKYLFQRQVTLAQRVLNSKKGDAFYESAISFTSGIMPLVLCLKKIPLLKNSHFALMLDDAHDLNSYQIAILNSWIAYRDNSLFTFKVATIKVNSPPLITSSGGTILDGHDFTLIDMEQPYQNRYSDFGKLSRSIIEKRLQNVNLSREPDDFFPENPQFKKDIEKFEKLAKDEFISKNPTALPKQLNDYVYKYGRAKYFRDRSKKANIPPYSGLETLIHLSTGVIRNLLEPCYWMYDKMISDKHASGEKNIKIDMIPPSIQTQIILERSRRKWDYIREGLDKSIEGCNKEQAGQIYRLFDHLAILFKKRLLHHKSEPRAIVFTVSDINYEYYEGLINLLEIAHKGQILYTYTSSAKDHSRREKYYVPNRILWPERGLDPVGQYSRVSLKTRDLWAAAKNNVEIPFSLEERVPK